MHGRGRAPQPELGNGRRTPILGEDPGQRESVTTLRSWKSRDGPGLRGGCLSSAFISQENTRLKIQAREFLSPLEGRKTPPGTTQGEKLRL